MLLYLTMSPSITKAEQVLQHNWCMLDVLNCIKSLQMSRATFLGTVQISFSKQVQLCTLVAAKLSHKMLLMFVPRHVHLPSV
jgi:hypothetical protein